VLLAILPVGIRDAVAAVIPVTTSSQKISSSGGCSLQEAIFSANFDSNLAIAGYTGSTPDVVVTECVPGSGDDIIVLPTASLLRLSRAVDDAYNPTGPTATPIISSNITILANGATLEWAGASAFRLFAVASAGHLTIRRAYIRGFRAQGGNGGAGGGGGLGAGGAIFVMGGTLVIEASTFASNAAYGGGGGVGLSGGGGGIGGNGGLGWNDHVGAVCLSGGGGGGARGTGGDGCSVMGGGGGGTLRNGQRGGAGGFDCGASGGAGGGDASCAGGGGGGGGVDPFVLCIGFDGGRGHYGGGGGGGDYQCGGHGGGGGFGGGGGASGWAGFFGEDGGNGGFGGGGGAGNDGGVSDGDPGNGGFFAGNAGSGGGGGGAGLGGAIFNEGGTVDIRNSTFFANTTQGGYSEKAQDGITGGGAIFSVNGHLTVLNSTISGGLAHVGGGILVVQHEESKPTSLVLENTLIANNGVGECAVTGFSIAVAFAGNLIQSNVDSAEFDGKTFVGCQGVVTSSDPQLGPLQYNQGATPTMAISGSSPARNAADPATSLPVDQRRQPRPANGGFDIGAYELCLEGTAAAFECVILAGIDPGEAVQLTMQVQPVAGGTTAPAPGTQQVQRDSVIPLKATPGPGFRFTDWSSNVANPGKISTTVFMNASQTVTANFAVCACANDVSGSVDVTMRDPIDQNTKRYVQIVTLTNNSSGTIAGPISLVLDDLPEGVMLSNLSGYTSLMLPAGSAYIDTPVPQLAPGQSITFPLLFTNPGRIPLSLMTRVLAHSGSR
jgi:hypothetical protein